MRLIWEEHFTKWFAFRRSIPEGSAFGRSFLWEEPLWEELRGMYASAFYGHPHTVGAARVFMTPTRLSGTDLVPSVPTTFIFPPSFDHSVRLAIVGGE